jgi:DNA-binding transcriptional LysR family regulator
MPAVPWNDRIRRRLKLRSLDVLMAVAETGSMGKAAGLLNMSQPAISKAIVELEDAVGFRLLDRSRRGVEPTPYGKLLLKRGVAVFDELRQGFKDLEFLSDPTLGEVRIGATDPITAAIVLPVVDRLTRLHPRMKFTAIVADTVPLLDALNERSVDLVMTRIARPVIEDFHAETLFYDTLVVATGAQNPLIRRRGLRLGDIMGEPWVFPISNFFGGLIAGIFGEAGLEPPQPTVATSSSTLRHGLLTTQRFLTIIAGFSLVLPSRRTDLRALLKLPNTRHPVAVLTLKNRLRSPAAQMFIDQVRELTKSLKNA